MRARSRTPMLKLGALLAAQDMGAAGERGPEPSMSHEAKPRTDTLNSARNVLELAERDLPATGSQLRWKSKWLKASREYANAAAQ